MTSYQPPPTAAPATGGIRMVSKSRRRWRRFAAAALRSRIGLVLAVIVAWIIFSAAVSSIIWLRHERRQPWLVYFYNSFTVFSNLSDELGLVIERPPSGAFRVRVGDMLLNLALIAGGMIGIAALTSAVTQRSLSRNEERFDAILDEFRRLAILATTPPSPGWSPPDPHRILSLVIERIHDEIMPYRTNLSLHTVNAYELDSLLVSVIGRIIRERRVLEDPPAAFAAYDPRRLERVIRWMEGLEHLKEELETESASPVQRAFVEAWRDLSVELRRRVRTWQTPSAS